MGTILWPSRRPRPPTSPPLSVRLRAPLMEAFPTGPPTMTTPKGPQEQVTLVFPTLATPTTLPPSIRTGRMETDPITSPTTSNGLLTANHQLTLWIFGRSNYV